MPLQILPKFWQNCSGSRSQKVKFSHKKTGKNFVSGLLWGYLYYSTVVPHIFLLENILDRELLSLSRVEWFSTSFFFENVHISADQVYFQELNSKKSAISAARAHRMRGTVFIFKNHRDHIFFYLNICTDLSYTSKNNLQNKIWKIFLFYTYYFLFSENGKTVFDHVQGQNKFFFEFVSIFSF